MTSSSYVSSKPMAIGLCLALVTILFGFGMGAVFGAQESAIKAHLEDSGTAALSNAYSGDVAAKDAVVKKSWSYLKRSHMHGSAIGTAALATILALLLLAGTSKMAQWSALSLGVGGLLYALFWLFAGLTAPALGSTSLAKEQLSFIALPGAGLCILGLLGAMACILKVSVQTPSVSK